MAVKNAVASAWNVATRADGKKYSRIDTTVPSAPSVTATVSGTAPESQIDIVITSSTDAQSAIIGYNIYRATASGGPYTLLVSLHPSTTYTNSNLPELTQYWYKASAVNAFDLESSLSAADEATTTSPNQQLTPFPVFGVYEDLVTSRGGTAVPSSNTRYWSEKPAVPSAGGTTSLTNGQTLTLSSDGVTTRIADGTYSNVTLNLNGSSCILAAQSQNGVVFTGSSRITINGSTCDVLGFKWLDSAITTGAYVDINGDDNRLALCILDGAENSPTTALLSRVNDDGKRNRVCYNTFRNDDSAGRYVHVEQSAGSIYNRIDHNKFLNKRGVAGDTEILQIGQNQSAVNYFTLIDSNYCEGYTASDTEIVSLKAGCIMLINNVMEDCIGRWNCRESSKVDWYANWIFGGDLTNSGGIQLQGADNRVLCNYIVDINPTANSERPSIRFSSGGTGTFVATSNSEASFNTLLSSRIPLKFGSGTGPTAPSNNKVYNNAIDPASGNGVTNDASSGTTGGGNIIRSPGMSASWLTSATPGLTVTSGFSVPTAAGNLDGAGVSGWSAVATVDILGNPIPASNPNIGCFQDGWDFANDPVQAIITAAGA